MQIKGIVITGKLFIEKYKKFIFEHKCGFFFHLMIYHTYHTDKTSKNLVMRMLETSGGNKTVNIYFRLGSFSLKSVFSESTLLGTWTTKFPFNKKLFNK